MSLITDLLILLAVIICLVLFTIRLRFKLLKLWKDVTSKEVLFHKLLLESTLKNYEKFLSMPFFENM